MSNYKITLPDGTVIEGEQPHTVVEMALAMDGEVESDASCAHDLPIDWKERWQRFLKEESSEAREHIFTR